MSGFGPWRPANNGAGARIWFLYRDAPRVEDRYRYSKVGRLVRYASMKTAQRAADRLNAAEPVSEAEQYAADLDGSREGAHVRQVIALWPKRPPSSAMRLPEVRNVVAMLERADRGEVTILTSCPPLFDRPYTGRYLRDRPDGGFVLEVDGREVTFGPEYRDQLGAA